MRIKRCFSTAFLLGFSRLAIASSPDGAVPPMAQTNVSPVLLSTSSPPAAAPVPLPGKAHYHLEKLTPVNSSQYPVPSRQAQRRYFHFQNTQGLHTIIYEEAPGSAPSPAMQSFQQVMGQKGMSCSIDLDCRETAFCTGNCRRLYYETSNTPNDLEMISRNHCDVASYHCEYTTAEAGRTGP